MNRSFWLIFLLFFSATAVGAGWFAVNAPEASRPNFADLGAVELKKEKPPLPPALLGRSLDPGFEAVLRRPLFRSGRSGASVARSSVGAPVALDAKRVGYRSVLPPPAPPPKRDFEAFKTPLAPQDDFQAAFGVTKPEHRQYFGPHLLPGESITSDGAPPTTSSSVVREVEPPSAAPGAAPVPRQRPKREEPSVVGAAIASLTSPRTGAPRDRSEAASAALPIDDIILLGVLLRRGKTDRALIRLSSGESRRVTLGDTVSGWRVSAISVDSIKLKRASVTREIKVPE